MNVKTEGFEVIEQPAFITANAEPGMPQSVRDGREIVVRWLDKNGKRKETTLPKMADIEAERVAEDLRKAFGEFRDFVKACGATARG